MELLYIWINRARNICKQGYNFSMQNRFDILVKEKNVILSEVERQLYIENFFDEDGIIENITAVVGKNGAGKTSLLEALCDLNCYPLNMENQDEYRELAKDEYERNQKIMIFRQKNEIIIYHNFQPNELKNETGYREVNLYQHSEISRSIYAESKDFNDITTIYLTNSSYNYGKNGISTNGQLAEVVLTPGALDVIAGIYYKKLLQLENGKLHNEYLFGLNRAIKEQRKTVNFQQICDILYFQILHQENMLEQYDGLVSTKLGLSFYSCIKILEQVYPDYHDTTYLNINQMKMSGTKRYLCEKYINFNKYLAVFTNADLKNIISTLKLNLLFECIITFDIPFMEYKDNDNFSKVLNYIEKVVHIQKDGQLKKYFLHSLSEILELEKIVINACKCTNLVPIDDLAYKTDVFFDKNTDDKNYIEFLDYIKRAYDNEYSFILKYLEIRNLEMSSGERAFQNFFSWINLIPEFNKIEEKIPKRLHNTILLLIDEIDLYLHPEWQKNIIFNIIQEIKRQFFEYNVQIVFTTHSPLVLSDIPRENTIYLVTKDGKSVPDKNDCHRETFGADVYNLLNDAFYLSSGSMGKFAEQKINKILDKLNKCIDSELLLTDVEILEFNNEILKIGNDLVKTKMLYMLDKSFNKMNKYNEIKLLNSRKELLEKQIQELLNGGVE